MRPDELDDVLALLDHPVPPADVDALIRSARRGAAGTRRAAAVVVAALAVGTGMAFALPGSPIRAWLASPPSASSPAGIAVAPGGGLVVRLAGPTGSVARVSLSEAALVEVRGPAGSLRFVSEPARLLVDVTTGDTIDVAIPLGANLVELEVGGETVFSNRASTIDTDAPRDVEGRYLVAIGAAGS